MLDAVNAVACRMNCQAYQGDWKAIGDSYALVIKYMGWRSFLDFYCCVV